MNKKGQNSIVISLMIILGILLCCFLIWYIPHFSLGWDTGIMVGKLIGYDSNMFGTKTVFVLESRTIFEEGKGLSQSQIKLCSDYDDVEIHKLVEKYINQEVTIEYKERRVGYYPFKYCHESPITAIYLTNSSEEKE